MDILKLTNDVLSVDHILKEASSETCGAVSMFVGTTRDNFEGKKVVQLEYEAYDAMALKVMKSICGDIRKEWADVHNIAIYHRLGTVPVLEASVVIAISSPHRSDAMDAVKYCIEHLKEGGLSIPSDSHKTSDNLTQQFTIDPQIIQVNASNDEIQRRIKNYIDRKREQINLCNIQDFITNKGDVKEISETGESSCARIDAVLVKRKDSKGHLSVMRVKNEWGPQTKVPKREPNPSSKESQQHPIGAIDERLSNAETHLNIAKPISSDIYSRLKKIEDRILELESISPEYVMFWSKNSQNNSCDNTSTNPNIPKKFKYTSDEIKRKLEAMEHTK